MWVRSLSGVDPLKKEMATRSSIIAWEIPWTEEPSGLQSRGCKDSNTIEQLNSKWNRLQNRIHHSHDNLT